MKILMFGRGVISTQYGWVFEQVGHDVTFYVRPGRKLQSMDSVDLNIYDARKNIKGILIKENWKTELTEEINSNFDLIIVSVQHYHLKDAIDLLADKIGNASVLIFNNLWEEPKEVVSRIPENQLVWGFPQAGGGFDAKGVLNGSILGNVILGTFGTSQTARGMEVKHLFKSSGFKIKENKDFRSYLFSHFVINAALHIENVKYKTGLSVSSLEILQTTQFWRAVILNGKELLPLLKARNVDIKSSSELKVLNLPPWVLSLVMKVSINFLPPLRQVFAGHSNPVETKSYCLDVLASSRELGIHLPRYESGSSKL